jgi:hypothetical protein
VGQSPFSEWAAPLLFDQCLRAGDQRVVARRQNAPMTATCISSMPAATPAVDHCSLVVGSLTEDAFIY